MEGATNEKQEQALASSSPRKRSGLRRFGRTFFIIFLLAFAGFIYGRFYFVFGEGVKSGHLNYAVKKGNLFKTYEGKLIQEGYKSKTAGAIQSYEFEFSIKSKRIYDILSANSGKRFELHYREYHGILPWRGNTRYIVDSILFMRDE